MGDETFGVVHKPLRNRVERIIYYPLYPSRQLQSCVYDCMSKSAGEDGESDVEVSEPIVGPEYEQLELL